MGKAVHDGTNKKNDMDTKSPHLPMIVATPVSNRHVSAGRVHLKAVAIDMVAKQYINA